MATKITKNVQSLVASSLYDYIREGGNDRSFYLSLAYYNDSDYIEHAGVADSESAFVGGVSDSEYDAADFDGYLRSTTSLHKVFKGGVSRVVPRIDWRQGRIYEGWTPNSTNHYVLMREYFNGVAKINVYKCLYSPGTPSTYNPQGALPLPFQTIDGYWWLYMYTISNSEALRFLTPNWMPCPEKVVASEIASLQQGTNRYYQYIQQVSATKGAIYNIAIDSDAASAQFPTLRLGGLKRVVAKNTDIFAADSDAYQADIAWDSENNKMYAKLVSAGSGYGSNIEFTDDSERPISWITPFVASGLGHGSDAPTELGARYMMVSSRVTPSDEILYLMDGTFKMINLVMNPIDLTTDAIGTNDYYVAARSFTTTATNEFVVGDILKSRFKDEGRRIRVVGKNDTLIYYTDITPVALNKTGYLGDSEYISDETGTKFAIVKSNFNRNISYTYNDVVLVEVVDTPIKREADQIESINLIFKF